MKNLITALFLLMAAVPATAELSGRQIADKVKNANEPPTMITRARLQLFSGARATSAAETRRVVMKSRVRGGATSMVLRFMDSSYRGTTFLTLEKPGQPTVHYLYLKSLGRARQIAASEKQNNFVDTDFTNEDLGGIRLDDYRFKKISDMQRGGRTYYRVWAYRKDKNARFPRYLAIVEAGTFVMVEARIFNRSGKLAKIMKASDVRKVGGRYHIPHRIEMQDFDANHKSVITVTSVKVNVRISNDAFDPAEMKSPW